MRCGRGGEISSINESVQSRDGRPFGTRRKEIEGKKGGRFRHLKSASESFLAVRVRLIKGRRRGLQFRFLETH